ncbi:Phosphoribosylaminoimidazole-succinocarboxamide synthase [Mycetocola reblochoni REB411]|uniref:Phosphoribosylaminoimidazole-succinocarboxamide synthase n=1 Tax=Mycetocola reblochoni REB411 TaxID=1255698 RepID=A0A1R4IG00_9MICO|nr:Phosphoribosylaminoimidazole-succinocarboxamide synthase [Mycetocola reblochoni REB411]
MSTATDIPGWTHEYSGKVRDLYRSDDPERSDEVLVVASDRVSAFDHALEPGIPGKGALLTGLSRWWFTRLDVPNHLLDGADPGAGLPEAVASRAMRVTRLEMFPIECVVRGYLTGSGWAEYVETGTVCGVALPAGLSNGDRLPEPIFTPASKAPLGQHDENIDFDRMVELVGAEDAEALRGLSLGIYTAAAAIAEGRGLLIADTKFEFGRHGSTGEVTLGDEVLTSDSSRYWDAAAHRDGATSAARMASFDKQIVRDWVSAHWDGTGEPPVLPAAIVERTAERYRELIGRLTGD